MDLSKAKMLVISKNEKDSAAMRAYFERIRDLPEPTFVVNELVSADGFDFAVFDAHSLPDIPSENVFLTLPEHDQQYMHLLDKYLTDGAIRYIVWYGERYHRLNRERCPSANSKFTLFARIRELVDFMNYYSEKP